MAPPRGHRLYIGLNREKHENSSCLKPLDLEPYLVCALGLLGPLVHENKASHFMWIVCWMIHKKNGSELTLFGHGLQLIRGSLKELLCQKFLKFSLYM